MKTIVFQPKAAKQLDKLPVAAREQISEGLDRYAIFGAGDVNFKGGPGGKGPPPGKGPPF